MTMAVHQGLVLTYDEKGARRIVAESQRRHAKDAPRSSTPWWERIPTGFGSMVTDPETVN